MNKIFIIAALLIAGAIVFSPIALHSYKMSECMEIQMKSIEGYESLGEQYARERCFSLINSGN